MGTTTKALGCAKDKKIVFISHDLTQTGSPLLLIETAVKLREAGAHIELVSLADKTPRNNAAARNNIKVFPTRDSFELCAKADLVIANTTETRSWVNRYLERFSDRGGSLVWWIHELDADSYAGKMDSFGRAAMALFDSKASLKSWIGAGIRLPPFTRVIYPCVDGKFLEQSTRDLFSYPRTGLLRKFLPQPAIYGRSTIRKKLGIEPHDFVVTLVGLHPARKGHALLVNTVGKIVGENPNLSLKIILVGFASDYEKRKFIGGLNQPELKALDIRRAITTVPDPSPYYAASDALVINTQGLGENFGRVTIEGMTFKLPVLGTSAGGTPEIVDDGITGLLHPVGTPGQHVLTTNILTLMKDRAKAKAMGEAGYRRVQEKFTSSRFDAELDSLLETIFNNG